VLRFGRAAWADFLAGVRLGEFDLDRPEWTVWRQDDNGHRFVVARHADRAAAEAQAAQMQARGHKQMYWVERAASE
jgi:hypothetical protein